MVLSRHQQEKDLREAIEARRAAAEKLREALNLVEAARRKLAYNKSDAILFDLKQIADQLKDTAETLEDPEYDPTL